jgi:hypothetical protein
MKYNMEAKQGSSLTVENLIQNVTEITTCMSIILYFIASTTERSV